MRASRKYSKMTSSQKMNFPKMVGLTVTFIVMAVGSANAGQCILVPALKGAMPCNNCKYEASLGVNRDQPCERTLSAVLMGDLQYLGNRITQRAKHGVAGITGNALAYLPAKGYIGPDDFDLVMDYRNNKEVGKYFVHFTVTVQ
jgi:hypothetical protein